VIENEIEVRPLDDGDLVAIAQCHALYATVFPSAGFPSIGGDAPSVWVAKHDARTLGFVATRTIGRMMEIHAIAVDDTHRGTGVGRALLRETVRVARARRLAVITLQVSTANAAACTLYESEGFRVHRTLHAYYSPRHFADGGNAYQMRLLL
jgi:ribosomal-protein-alanine N-acetyltransferase